MSRRGFWALFCALAVGALPAHAADDASALLKKSRAWRGVVEVESRFEPGKRGPGEEIQKERVEFIVLTDPRRTTNGDHRLKLRLGRAKGRWSLKLKLRESRGAGEVVTRGAAAGHLNFTLKGVVDVVRGEVRLRFGTHGQRLLVKTTLSGMDGTGFGTFRSVATRRSILDGVVEKGALDAERRKAGGEREFDVKRGKYVRKVRIRWSLERIEPEVRGRIVDQHGRPVEGMRVIARTLAPGGPGYVARVLMLEAKSGHDGRFLIPAKIGTWGIEIPGQMEKGVLTRGWVMADAVQLRFDHVPDLEIEAIRYLHARLPKPHLLARHFTGDVNLYMEYVESRFSKARLAAARQRARSLSE